MIHPHPSSTECQELLESVPDAALVIDKRGSILACNQATSRLLGYQPGELAGQPLDRLLPDRYHAIHRQHMAAYFLKPWPRPMGLHMDLVARHKQGQEINVMVSLAPCETADGLLVTAFLRDLTEQKMLETAVRQAHDMLEQEVEIRTAELRQTNEQLRAEIAERQRVEEALRLLTQELTQRQEQLKQELRFLESYSLAPPSAITARAFHLLPLAESVPEIFADLTAEYGRLLDLAIEKRTYRIDDDLSDKLRSLAERLGDCNAGPHDVVLLHSRALKDKIAGMAYARANVYFEEGRLMVLKLMGYLAAYYRNYSLTFLQNIAHTPDTAPKNLPPARED